MGLEQASKPFHRADVEISGVDKPLVPIQRWQTAVKKREIQKSDQKETKEKSRAACEGVGGAEAGGKEIISL